MGVREVLLLYSLLYQDQSLVACPSKSHPLPQLLLYELLLWASSVASHLTWIILGKDSLDRLDSMGLDHRKASLSLGTGHKHLTDICES